MKKNTRKLMAGLLAVVTIFSLTACGGTPTETTDGGDGGAETEETTTAATTTTERTTNAEFDAVNEAAEALAATLDDSIEVTKKIKWLSWYEIDETAAGAMLFKSKYGIPEPGVVYPNDSRKGKATDEEIGNLIFAYENVSYADRYTRLAALVQSGDSPDMFVYEPANYPWGVYKGIYQPIDQYVDLTQPQWQTYIDLTEKLTWGGKHYAAAYATANTEILWYRKSVVEEAGIDDPYEQFKAGKWDWNAFLDACKKFSSPDEGKYCLDGWSPESAFVLTTGAPFVDIVDGKLTNNLYDPRIERVMTSVIEEVKNQHYVYPRWENGWSISYANWANGDTLFFTEGSFAYEERWKKYRDKNGWADDEIQLVAYPRDPNADQYYQAGKTDPYMLVAGAKNPEGFAAWINCEAIASMDPATAEASRAKLTADHGWTEAQLNALDEFRALKQVLSFQDGIGEDIADGQSAEMPVQQLTKGVYVETYGKSYTQVRAENEGEIGARIDQINASVGA